MYLVRKECLVCHCLQHIKKKTPMRVCAHGGYLRSIVHILTCVSGLFRAETSLSSFFFVVVFLAACKVLAILRQLFWEAKCLD